MTNMCGTKQYAINEKISSYFCTHLLCPIFPIYDFHQDQGEFLDSLHPFKLLPQTITHIFQFGYLSKCLSKHTALLQTPECISKCYLLITW